MKKWRTKSGTVVFTEKELACPCCGKCNMDEEFMSEAVEMREHSGFPWVITSAYRCEKHNKKVGGYPSSRHLAGEALDILAHSSQSFILLSLARRYNILGLGISQKGDFNQRFIHLDGRSKPAVWSY